MINPNDAIPERGYFTTEEGKVGDYQTEVDPLLLTVSDEDLLKEITERIDESAASVTRLREVQKWNEEYYYGDQLKRIGLLRWQAPAIENRIFMSVETLIPIMTANAGDPDIKALLEVPVGADPLETQVTTDSVAEYVDTLTAMLMYDYDVTYHLKDKVREIIRHWFIYRYGVGKFRYDTIDGQIHFDVVHPRNVFLPARSQPQNWIAEYKESTVSDLLIMFPKAKDLIKKEVWSDKGELPDTILGTKIGYYEYWRDTFVAWKLNDVILDKKLNPYWDWQGEEKPIAMQPVPLPSGDIIEQPIMELYKYRVLNRPAMPYFIFNYFNVTGTKYDDTGYIEQARPLQDLINKRKRQIAAIADDSGLVVASGDGIKKEEFQKYDGSPRSKLWISSGNPNQVVARLAGAQASPTMLADLQDSREASDNLFGTQAVTRGERTGAAESGVAREILRQGDVSRLGPLGERVEDFLQEVYLFDIQMRMLFTDQDYSVPIASPAGGEELKNMTFNRNSVPMVKVKEQLTIDGKMTEEEYFRPVPITLRVRKASTLPKDEVAEYERAVQAFQAGLIDPLTMYEKNGEINPIQKLERLIKWTTNPISLLPPDKQMELMATAPPLPPGAEGEEEAPPE